MSRSDSDAIRRRQDKVARGEARKAKQERMAARTAAEKAAIEAKQQQLVAEAREARERGEIPNDPPTRKRKPLPHGGAPVLGTRSVPDPYEHGARLMAIVNLAEHPLEMMLSRRRLTQPQYEAGVRYRSIYERAMIGPGRGIDPERIKVDGGKLGDPLTDGVLDAHQELKRLKGVLGEVGFDLVTLIAGTGRTINEVATCLRLPDADRIKVAYVSVRFREALDVLALKVWGAQADAARPGEGIRSERGLGSGLVDPRAVETANQTYLRRRGIAL